MIRAIVASYLSSMRHLIFRCSGKFIEAKGDCSDSLLAGIAHQAKQCSRVDPRGKENSDLYIGEKMRRYAFEGCGAQALCQLVSRSRLLCALSKERRQIGKTLWFAWAC